MSSNFYAVIMAGGGGTRLWPLSREARPKQMLPLVDERTLFQIAVDRLRDLFPPDRVLVVTVREQAPELSAQCPDIPKENFIIESQPKGTASVVGLAAVVLRNYDPDAIMTVLTSDHIIRDETRFRGLLSVAKDVAEEDYLVTLGITPTYAATGYGYVQRGDLIGIYQGQEVYRAIRFIEKPDHDRAEELVSSGDHTWNSGMFAWRAERILEEFTHQMPDHYAKLEQIAEVWGKSNQDEILAQIWPTLVPETIDYGIMEKAKGVALIPADQLGWSDVGSWDSLYDVLEKNREGNILIGGEHIQMDARNSLIYVDGDRQLVVAIGVEDLIVVDTDDVLLLCKKDQAQKVRQIVKHLKKNNRDYL